MTSATLLCLLLAGCSSPSAESGDMRVIAEPRPNPPPPPPPLTPVDGEITLDMLDASEPVKLGFRDDGPPDAAGSQQVATVLAAALNAYLDALQAGVADLTLLDADWAELPGGPDITPLTSLATRENPIVSATYDIVVQFENNATLASALVTVARLDGTTASIDLAFDVGEGAASLLLFDGGTA